MFENDIWKIEKAGLHYFGHTGSVRLQVEISRPGAGWAFTLRVDRVRELMAILGIDCEDGAYLHEVLVGRYITTIGKDGKQISAPVGQVGDPYGIELMDIGESA